jgi:hypothetical protein
MSEVINYAIHEYEGLETIADLSWEAKQNEKRLVILWPNEDLIHMADTMGLIAYLTFASSYDEGITKITYFT